MKKRSKQTEATKHLRYKVVEVSSVTDQDLENVINEWSSDGWSFEGIQFAMRESSKRPSMAFVLFTRSALSIVEGQDAGSAGE